MVRPLHWDTFDGPMSDWNAYGPPRAYIDTGNMVPDGVGGLLSTFVDSTFTSYYIQRVTDSGSAEYAMPTGTNALAMVGDDATGYFISATLDGVTAADTRNGSQKWTATGGMWSLPIATRLGGGVDLFDGTTLTVLDGSGQAVATRAVPVSQIDFAQSPRSETFIGMPECCDYAALAGPETTDESMYSFAAFDYAGQWNVGNVQLSGAPTMPDCWTGSPFSFPDGEKTRLRREYKEKGVQLIPECWMFTDQGSMFFNFGTLNMGNYGVGLLTDAFLRPASSGFSLDAWFASAYNIDPNMNFTINSGYRSPKKNARVSGAARNSRHMYGDAADVNTTSKPMWDKMIQAARTLGMWTEPLAGPCKDACAHADLRPQNWAPATLKNMAPYRPGTWDPR